VANFQKINILLLFSSSDIGGAERSLSRMALFSKDNTISYQLATFSTNGTWSKWILSKAGNPICFNHSFWKLVKYVSTEKPDIIYIIGFRLSVLLRIVKVFFPKMHLVQGVRWDPSSNVMLDKTFRFVERLFGFLLDGYIVNSNSAKQSLNKLVNNNIVLIYNGVANIPKVNLKKSNNKNIITVANLSARKGYEDYLSAIAIVVKKVPESRFLFLGNDNLNGKIQQLIIDNNLESSVKYLGFQEKIDQLLENSAVFVLPSLYGEGCPTSILEAFSFSLPVVAYQIDGIPELVTHGVDGLLFDAGNVNALADGIISLLLDPEKSIKMGISGRQKVKDYFLLNDMLKKHNDYFLGLK
jgi:glycosyltransferase involved in cell wall biosynthesis